VSTSNLNNEQLQARALARARREAMLRRARRIRRAVAGLAVALFVATFLVVYVQLASGHDPALVANAAKRRAVSTSVTSTEASAAESSTSAEAAEASTATESSAASESSTGSEEPSSGASAVTTSQS
jgi:hypothetical protein